MSGAAPRSPEAASGSPILLVERLCDRFEAAWKAGERPRLEHYLDEVTEPLRPAFAHDLLRLELAYRHQLGESLARKAYLLRFPELGERVHAAFDTLERTACDGEPPADPAGSSEGHHAVLYRLLATSEERSSTGSLRNAAGLSDQPLPGNGKVAPHILGYEILEEIGRGGMGMVFKARQIRLDRIVALKMIHVGARLHPELAGRFLSEARTVARLRHPNVVQIHAIGEHDGLPYLELEYVEGGNLADRLDGSPVPSREAAVLIVQVAGDVREAHHLGIVHRDLKPANVLLSVDGVPKITDFGLAKSLQTDSDLTRSDVVLGSPSYMAPEQAGGKSNRVGPAADVFALGTILYELLTGRPPFRAATVLETLDQVRSADPVSPARLVPGVSRDLETICLTCLQKEPARRYPDAAALVDDLDRFLADRPIQARRSGSIERTWRWCRRNTRMAAAIALAAAGLLTTTVLSLSLAWTQHRSAARLRAEQVRTLEEKERAELSYRQAKRVVDEFLTSVSINLVFEEPRESAELRALAHRLLDSAIVSYQSLLLDRSDDRETLEHLAKVYLHLSDFLARTSSDSERLSPTGQALAIYRRLAALNPAVADYQESIGVCLIDIAIAQSHSNQNAAALESFREATVLLEALLTSQPSRRALRVTLSNGYIRSSHLLNRLGRTDESARTLTRARDLLLEQTRRDPDGVRGWASLADAYKHLGMIYTAKLSDRLRALVQARDLFQRLREAHPTRVTFQDGLADSFSKSGELYRIAGRLAEAHDLFQRARFLWEDAAQHQPNFALFRANLGQTHLFLGWVLQEMGRTDEASRSFERAFQINDDLCRAAPEELWYHENLAATLVARGRIQRVRGATAEARESLERGVRLYESLPQLATWNKYRFAGGLAQLSELIAGTRAGVAPPGVTATGLADRAMTLLHEAIASNFRRYHYLRLDPILDPLRTRPDFQFLLLNQAFPVDPFQVEEELEPAGA